MGTTTTTPSRRVIPTTNPTPTPTPTTKRDSTSQNSGNGLSSPSPRRKSITSTTTPSSSKPTTTRKSLLLLSKPNSNSPPSLFQSHPIKPPSSSSNIKSPVPPTARPNHHASHQQLIASLQSQLLSLTTQLQQAQSSNLHLQSQNSSLSLQLAAAHSKISSLTASAHTHQESEESISEFKNPKSHEIQKLSPGKLEPPTISKGDKTKIHITNTPPPQVSIAAPSPPPPPPPPLPRRPAPKAVSSQKASAVAELYQSLATKRGNGYASVQDKNSNKTSSAHNSIVDEIQNRSAHLLAIKKDIETKGELINGLIQKVLDAVYADIEQVLSFVDWLDKQLSLLADEQSVLKHFKWPEKKADSMREAAIEYRNLKLLEEEVSSYRDDTQVPCSVALKKMARLLDKSERSLQRLIQLRSSAMLSYRSHKIPTDWMLDTGIVSKIKKASINLAKTYVKRVTLQLESTRNSERESTQEALLLQGVHFAYRAHQFCGGLDSETICAVEEIRRRVPGQLQGFAGIGIPSS